MYFQDTLILPRHQATEGRINRLHVLTVFNFLGAIRNRRTRNITQILIAQVSYKFAVKLFRNSSLKRLVTAKLQLSGL